MSKKWLHELLEKVTNCWEWHSLALHIGFRYAQPDPGDDCWEIWDSSSDKKTVWRRPRHGPVVWCGLPYHDEKKPFSEEDDRLWRAAAAHEAAYENKAGTKLRN